MVAGQATRIAEKRVVSEQRRHATLAAKTPEEWRLLKERTRATTAAKPPKELSLEEVQTQKDKRSAARKRINAAEAAERKEVSTSTEVTVDLSTLTGAPAPRASTLSDNEVLYQLPIAFDLRDRPRPPNLDKPQHRKARVWGNKRNAPYKYGSLPGRFETLTD